MNSSAFVRGIAVCALVALSGDARAYEVYTVTRTDDPAPDGCTPGDCSLREAMLAANASAGLDDVMLAAGTYVLGSTVEVEGEVRIIGAGIAQTNVTAASVAVDTLFHLDEVAPPTLGLMNLSLDALGGDEVAGKASATLALDHVALPNPDGGIYLEYAAEGGIVNVDDAQIAGLFGFYGTRIAWINDSRFGRLALLQADPGVTYQLGLSRVVVDGSTRDNSALRLDSAGDVFFDQVTVQDTRYGFYIDEAPASLTIDGLRYLRNQAPMQVVSGADLTLVHAEFRDNRPTEVNEPDEPAALWISSGGSHVVVADSTFADNTGSGDTGGAVLVEGGAELSLRNVTFHGNSFTATAAAAGARGGAVGYRAASNDTVLTLQNVTIDAPTIAPAGMEGWAFGGRGSGTDVTLNIFNSVFVGSCRSDGVVPDYAIGNVKTSGDNCGFGSSGNLLGVSRADVALGALGDHGGPTATMLPAASSVVVDAGVSLGCLDADQRGLPRPAGGSCDAGAIESGDGIFANGFN